MGNSVFQCVPNLSEGRRPEVVEQAARAVQAVSAVRLLDYSYDVDHNRSVFTLIGQAEPLIQAVLALYETAASSIDLREHRGAHPRIGAVDVVPFVPLEGADMAVADALAKRLGQVVVERFNIPIYFYEESASLPERRSLANLRRGGFERLQQEITFPERRPDLGPAQVHPTLGASCVGARRPLVAFNVLLNTANVKVAQAVARKVRERDGGLRYVRALGIFLASRGLAQVSMNLLDPDRTAIYTALEMVRMEAARYGAAVISTELIGCMSLKALTDTAAYYLQSEQLEPRRILERGLLDMYKG